MIYISSPYTGKQTQMSQRYHRVMEFAAEGLKAGFIVFSPIVHCHQMAKVHKMPKDFQFWMEYNYKMIDVCDELMILALPGSTESKGVQAEILYAKQAGKKITEWIPETDMVEAFGYHCKTFWRLLGNKRRATAGLDL